MATFGQWNKSRALRRVAWICGPETVLVDEVAKAYLASFSQSTQYKWMNALGDSEKSIWDTVFSQPSGSRLLSISGSENLKELNSNLEVLVNEGLDEHTTLFYSSAPDFLRVEAGKKKVLHPALSVLQKSRHGQLIRCVLPSKEQDLEDLVASWWPEAGRNFAAQLLSRTNSLSEVRELCTKARCAGLPPTQDSLDAVWVPSLASSFIEALFSGNKSAAFTAASHVTDIGSVISFLYFRIKVLRSISQAMNEGLDNRQQAMRLDLDPYLLRKLRVFAASYDLRKAYRHTQLLVVAESAHKSGVREGILEMLVAGW